MVGVGGGVVLPVFLHGFCMFQHCLVCWFRMLALVLAGGSMMWPGLALGHVGLRGDGFRGGGLPVLVLLGFLGGCIVDFWGVLLFCVLGGGAGVLDLYPNCV